MSSYPDVRRFFSGPRPGRAERFEAGLRLRREVPLSVHALVPGGTRDPLGVLHAQDADRDPTLLPLRYERLGNDPFAYLRGSAAVMAADLAALPASGITVQLCGDAHLANFGLFATRERHRVFDLNDFDETLPGPFEWDVKRLAASVGAAGLAFEHKPKRVRRAAAMAAEGYRGGIAGLSKLGVLQAWYSRLDVDNLVRSVGGGALTESVRGARRKSGRKTRLHAAERLTEMVPTGRRFRADPPLLVPLATGETEAVIAGLVPTYEGYLRSLPPDVVAVLARFSFTDLARKVVGVGSVGTAALVMLMESGDGEPLVLQLKQAVPSVLEPHLHASSFDNSAMRVVVGQRLLQAAGDPFLGWSRAEDGTEFYVRQLWDHKAAIDPAHLSCDALGEYARVCGAVLARGHARVGDPVVIAGYLGDSDEFDRAIAEFAMSYAELAARDHAALTAA